MNLATWLPQARMKNIEDSTLVIEFDADQVTARKIVEKNENRIILEEFLRSNTANLSSLEIRSKLQSALPEPKKTALNDGLPLADSVNPEEGQKALEDPHVANVVDVFKGRIVDIQ